MSNTSRRISRIWKIAICLFLIAVGIIFGIPRYNRFVLNARESEVRANLASLVLFLKNFQLEFPDRCPQTLQEMGFVPEGAGRTRAFYLKESDVPPGHSEILGKENLPFCKNKEFRIVATFEDSHANVLTFWTIDQNRTISKLPVTAPL